MLIEPATASAGDKPKKVKPQRFDDVLGEAPDNSPEYRLYKRQGAGILTRDIVSRIEYLKAHKGRDFTADYKRLAIAYLQDELTERRKQDK